MTVRALLRNMWLVLLVGTMAVLAAIVATSQAVPKYRAEGTYVIGPSTDLTEPETIVRSFDSLQGQGIVPTLVELLSSKTLAARVAEPLGVSRSELKAYEVRANVLSSSNTLQLTVVGPDPEATAQLATGIGREASAVFERLYTVYQIEPLDIPRTPEKPSSPSLTRNSVLALILGLSAGGALAVLRTRYASSRHPGQGALAASNAPSEAMSPPASGVSRRPEGVAGGVAEPSVSAPPPLWDVHFGSAGAAEADVSREAAIATVPGVASRTDVPPGADVAPGPEVRPGQHVVANPQRRPELEVAAAPMGRDESAEPPAVSAAKASPTPSGPGWPPALPKSPKVVLPPSAAPQAAYQEQRTSGLPAPLGERPGWA